MREKAADAGGSLSAPCMWCSFPNVAKRGTDHFKKLLGQVTRQDPQPAADPAAAAVPAAAETSKTAAGATVVKTEAKDPPKRTFAGPLFGGS